MSSAPEQCKQRVQRIVNLLSDQQRRNCGDVLEFLVTVNFVTDVLNEYDNMRSTMNADLSLVARYLNEYYDLLQQLVSENRFARFVTSNRVRKKLELLNSNLHTEVAITSVSVSPRDTPSLCSSSWLLAHCLA